MTNKDEKLFSKSSSNKVSTDILISIRKGFAFFFKSGIFSIFIFILLDQVSKQLAQLFLLKEGNSVVVIPKLLNFTLVYNDGAAFGSMAGNRFFLIGSSLVMGIGMCLFLGFMFRKISLVGRISLFMMIGGCFGNFIDRAFYPDGLVVDFIQFVWFFGIKNFAVFNLADTFLVLGIGIFVIGEIVQLIYDHIMNKKKLHLLEMEELSNNDNYSLKKTNEGVFVCNFIDANEKVNLIEKYNAKNLESISNEEIVIDKISIDKLKDKFDKNEQQ